jgi:hypothetical protein
MTSTLRGAELTAEMKFRMGMHVWGGKGAVATQLTADDSLQCDVGERMRRDQGESEKSLRRQGSIR